MVAISLLKVLKLQNKKKYIENYTKKVLKKKSKLQVNMI